MLRRYTTQAGRTRMVRIQASARVNTEKGRKRQPKMTPTPEAVQKVNLRNAIWTLCVLLNSNFQGGDLHLTLTYAKEPTKEEAKRKLQGFIRKLREYHKKRGTQLKWIAATEYENKRIHHHVVISKTDIDVIEQIWKEGWVTPKIMDNSGNYIKLAEYLIKETDKTFREKDSPYKQRYSRSRNLIMPEADFEEVSERVIKNGPKEDNGYYIDRDTIHTYEHAILGVECMQYIQVSLEEIPKRRRRRGKRARQEKEYRVPDQKQLTLDGLICDREEQGWK